jgi:hypothetical protein
VAAMLEDQQQLQLERWWPPTNGGKEAATSGLDGAIFFTLLSLPYCSCIRLEIAHFLEYLICHRGIFLSLYDIHVQVLFINYIKIEIKLIVVNLFLPRLGFYKFIVFLVILII